MKKSITIWALEGGINGDISVVKALETVKEAGFDGLEISFGKTGDITENYKKDELKEILKQFREIGCELSSISTLLLNDCSLTSKESQKRNEAYNIVSKMIEIASILEIPTISFSPGMVTETVGYKEAYELALEQVRNLGEKGKKFGVTLCVENVPQGLLLSPLEFNRFIDTIDSNAVKVCLDIGNTTFTGFPHHWIDILGDKIHKVHITDTRKRMGRLIEFTDPGKGQIDWNIVMSQLEKINYDDYLTIEAFENPRQNHETKLVELNKSLDKIIKENFGQ